MDRTPSWLSTLAKRSLTAVTVALIASHLLMPLEANAQLGAGSIPIPPLPGTPVIVNGNTYDTIKTQVDNIGVTLTTAAITTLMNVAQTFLQRIAHDVAIRILTGDKGQAPMFWEDGWADYMKNVGEDVGNQFISSINSEFFQPFGLDMCKPVDPLSMQLTLSGMPKSPDMLQPKCTAAGITRAFEQTKDSFSSNAELFKNFTPTFDPSSSDLNAGFTMHNAWLSQQDIAVNSAQLERVETKGYKEVTDFISGKIQTPAMAIQDTVNEANLLKAQNKGSEINLNVLATNAFKVGAIQLGLLTAATFVNTLLSGALQKLFGGMKGAHVDVAGVNLTQYESASNGNAAEARLTFSDLLTPNLYSTDQQDFVTELSSCPTPRGIFNCAMDDAFAVALRTADETGAYTVGHASQVVTNGQPPSNPAFLHKDWELIPDSEVKDNTDPACYQRAYCASNLAKLRYARILPVGWELAANSPFNQKRNGKYITLEEVIRGFNVCNDQGGADASHPWCKLIDPNWVLTAPPFQCRISGFGDTTLPGASMRLQECADAVSCLKRDDRGQCIGGYGFCLAERPVWRFNGDQCLERFASCRTYTNSANQLVSYVRNTLDYGSCSVDNVGCMWYATTLDPTASSTAWVPDKRAYFDGTVKTCASSDNGCTKLFTVVPGQPALNLLKNGSFEASPNGPDNNPDTTKLVGWTLASPYAMAQDLTKTSAIDGNQSYGSKATVPMATADPITVVPIRNYTLSLYARMADPGLNSHYTVNLRLLKANGQPVASSGNYFRSAGCTMNHAAVVGFDDDLTSDDWQRVQCSFVANADAATAVLELKGDDALIDGVQLEEGETATAFVDGLAAAMVETHMKLAPEELACTGATDDRPACADFARMCSQGDVGCQGYRDIQNLTAPEIPASLSAVDFCPATCVGYAEYRKQPSTFDLGRNADTRLDDPQDQTSATFIPAYAQSCSIQDVGCEEFTNVEAGAAGGESKAYFNYVRACEKPSENSATYFTWEGSDTTGYQLRTWSLIKDPSATPSPPKIVQKAGPDGVLKEPTSCNDYVWNQGTDPDCRQIFDADGNVFYAYFSQTVESSADCTDFRKDNSDLADCEKTGGAFTPSTGECIYKVVPAESSTCSQASAGCRAYIGLTGRNTTLVLSEDFKSATGTPFTAGELSNESILVGDKSLKISGNTPPLATATVFPSYPNQYYRVSFWAKTTDVLAQGNPARLTIDGRLVGQIPLGVDWRRYELGPFTASSTAATSAIAWENLPNATYLDSIRIERLNDVTFVVGNSWTVPTECDQTPEGLPQPQAMLECRAYQDRDGKVVDVRRFGHLCDEGSIGCKAFVDTRNSDDPYAQSFPISGTDVNTKTVSTGAFAWEDKYVGSWTAMRPADRYVYLIDEPKSHCQASADGCRAFGKPRLEQDTLEPKHTTSSSSDYDPTYLIDDIKSYLTPDGEPGLLCRKDELFCDVFKSGQTTAYFRNPFNHVCEWKDKVLLHADAANGVPADGEYTGWFKQGTEKPCYPGILSSGNTYLIQNSGDTSYAGWVGLCPIEQSECTEFRDSNDHTDPTHPSGKPYFFIKNKRLDLTSCNGQVDLLSGCILFRDMSDVRLRYSTNATYGKSHAEDDTPQSPIDCTTDPNNDFCLSQKTCQDVTIAGCHGEGCKDPKNAICINDESYLCQNPSDPAVKKQCDQWGKYGGCTAVDTVTKLQNASCKTDDDCKVTMSDSQTHSSYLVTGTCRIDNDANVVMKVRLDRDCAKWLGCSTGEVVFDPVQQKYTDVCTELAMCDVSKGSNAGSFCANYIDRNTEPILKPGKFFSRDAYTTRSVGFGQIDYSGYAVPDEFQAADIQNRKVGYELFAKEPAVANRFAQDYRLVAAVPETSNLVTFPADENVPVNTLYPTLYICTMKDTGRTGYFIPFTGAKGKRVCYFPIDALTARSSDVALNAASSTADPRNIENLSDIFRQSTDPKDDISLQRSFPPAECKAYPESDSPFPNLYVTEWDMTKDPFKPTTVAQGYEGVNLCQWGEDCACSYRKVKYGGMVTQYYSPFGMSPVAGICSGGTNDGQACAPQNTSGSTAQGQTPGTGTGDPGCPSGGRCLDITDVTLVRGQFGQCLERDMGRTVAGDPGRHPCLVWNPNPILSGTYDAAHYQPTAGYFPPVNSGEYYCLSYASPPFETVWSALSRTDWSNPRARGDVHSFSGTEVDPNTGLAVVADGANPYFFLPGQLSKFNYDTGYIAGKCSDDSALDDVCNTGGETVCSCHDGFSGKTALDHDFTEVWNAADSGEPNAGDMIHYASCTMPPIPPECFLGPNPHGACTAPPLGTCDPETCRTDPMSYQCDGIWRFTDLGQNIDGVGPYDGDQESPQADRCMRARTSNTDSNDNASWPGDLTGQTGIGPQDKAPDADYARGRWIMTGRGAGRTYMEYFFAAKPLGITEWLFPEMPAAQIQDPTTKKFSDVALTAMRERNFARFTFAPVNDAYAAACSLPPEYVDGVSVSNWSDASQVQAASNQIMQAFQQNFNGTMDRSSEKVLVDDNNVPIKLACSGLEGQDVDADTGYAGSDGQCYYKTWEINYRMDGTPKFEWLKSEGGTSFFDRRSTFYAHERTCSKSGFAIRAVFEDVSKDQNNLAQKDLDPNQLTGPYNFIGFWVTSCMVGHDFESYLYLSLKVKHADICQNLAQVVSPYTRESAAFADRVWANGSFAIPILGYNYGSGFAPFGSALVHGIPGNVPLFQTNAGSADAYSPLNPPTFIGAGQTYVTSRSSPLQKWAHLTNVFARIYRIYDFYDTGIPIKGWMCFGGPNDGKSCPPNPDGDTKIAAEDTQICAATGKCDTTNISQTQKNQIWRCNGLSGVNAGMECGGSFGVKSWDPSCHNAAMKRDPVTGVLQPQYSGCKLRTNAGWQACTDASGKLTGQYANPNDPLHFPGSSCAAGDQKWGVASAAKAQAFGCDSNSVVPDAYCYNPVDTGSKDCPLKVTGLTCLEDKFGPEKGHCSGGYEQARCISDTDCVFTSSQWWGAHDPGTSAPDVRPAYAVLPIQDPSLGVVYMPAATAGDTSLPAGSMGRIPRATIPGNTGPNPNILTHIEGYMFPFAQFITYGAFANANVLAASNLGMAWPAPEVVLMNGGAYVAPGLCEGAEGAQMDPSNMLGDSYPDQFGNPGIDPVTQQQVPSKAYTFGLYGGGYDIYALQAGRCDGGINDGQLCLSATHNADGTLISDDGQWPHRNVCSPPTSTVSGTCKTVTAAVDQITGRQTPAVYQGLKSCLSPTGDPFSKDPDLDNNSCTRSAGYHPRPDICGTDPSNEKCLIGYDLSIGNKQTSLDQSKSLAPTDVTPGFHKPSFLGLVGANPYDEEHIAPYPPQPPMIAAPDMSRTCESPGQCRIASVNAFALETQTSGPLSFAGGKAQVTMRFYGWAAHDQTPLKDVYIDWGDGTFTKIEDARLKNKKPFCGVDTECELVPGLTCSTDADCPPGGGKCSERGTCSQNPAKACFRDNECGTDGKCQFREFFGNSPDACEVGWFEFSHAYTCNPNGMGNCPSKLCSRNTTSTTDQVGNFNSCTDVSGQSNSCGVGDTCEAGLAPASVEGQVGGGCWDEQKASCLFTPRLMLVDSWNWCTGECRAGAMVGNQPSDTASSKVKHVNGGCWNGTETAKNTDITQKIMATTANECSLGFVNMNVRPWIVYQGAVQVGSYR